MVSNQQRPILKIVGKVVPVEWQGQLLNLFASQEQAEKALKQWSSIAKDKIEVKQHESLSGFIIRNDTNSIRIDVMGSVPPGPPLIEFEFATKFDCSQKIAHELIKSRTKLEKYALELHFAGLNTFELAQALNWAEREAMVFLNILKLDVDNVKRKIEKGKLYAQHAQQLNTSKIPQIRSWQSNRQNAVH